LMDKLAHKLEEHKLLADVSISAAAAMRETSTCILPDCANAEGVATAIVLEKVMKPFMAEHHIVSLPYAFLLQGQTIPHTTTELLLILTPGCLLSRTFLDSLIVASEVEGLAAYPVVANETFTFPSSDGIHELAGACSNQHACSSFLTLLFKQIATSFEAWNASDSHLQLAGMKVVQRLTRLRIAGSQANAHSRTSSPNTSHVGSSSQIAENHHEILQDLDSVLPTEEGNAVGFDEVQAAEGSDDELPVVYHNVSV